jgi:hypothetical protein
MPSIHKANSNYGYLGKVFKPVEEILLLGVDIAQLMDRTGK